MLDLDRQPHARHELSEGPRLLHGRRHAPPSAVERARLQHLDPGRLQSGLEAGAGAEGPGRRRRCSTAITAERAPIGKQIVNRANKSIEEFGPIFEALGLLDSTDPAEMKANMESRKEDDRRPPRSSAQAAARGDRLQGLRVRRAWRRDEPALQVEARSSPTARRIRASATIPSSSTSRRPSRARGCRMSGCEKGAQKLSIARSLRQGPLHADHRRSAATRWIEAAKRRLEGNGRRHHRRQGRPGLRLRGSLRRLGAMPARSATAGCVLVRPDQHVAWRAKKRPPMHRRTGEGLFADSRQEGHAPKPLRGRRHCAKKRQANCLTEEANGRETDLLLRGEIRRGRHLAHGPERRSIRASTRS